MMKPQRPDISTVIDLNPDGLPTGAVTLEQIQRGIFESVLGSMFVLDDSDPARDDAKDLPWPDDLES